MYDWRSRVSHDAFGSRTDSESKARIHTKHKASRARPFPRSESPVSRKAKRCLTFLAYSLIAIHFILIVNVATHLQDWMTSRKILKPVTDSSNYYGTVTFTNRYFGFFAPTVASDWVVHLVLTNGAGQKQAETMQVTTREMQIKMYSMVGQSLSGPGLDACAKSWALRAARESKDIRRVEVDVSQNEIPTMEQFRDGERVQSQLVYKNTINFSTAVGR